MNDMLDKPISIRIEEGSRYFIVLPAGWPVERAEQIAEGLERWSKENQQFAVLMPGIAIVKVSHSRFIWARMRGWLRSVGL